MEVNICRYSYICLRWLYACAFKGRKSEENSDIKLCCAYDVTFIAVTKTCLSTNQFFQVPSFQLTCWLTANLHVWSSLHLSARRSLWEHAAAIKSSRILFVSELHKAQKCTGRGSFGNKGVITAMLERAWADVLPWNVPWIVGWRCLGLPLYAYCCIPLHSSLTYVSQPKSFAIYKD
jgi:hypothetical protein